MGCAVGVRSGRTLLSGGSDVSIHLVFVPCADGRPSDRPEEWQSVLYIIVNAAQQVPAHPMPAQPSRARPFPFGRASSIPRPHPPRAKHAPTPSHAARCRCPLSLLTPRYPPLTFRRRWCAKPDASHHHPGGYRCLRFELRMLVLFDACGCTCVWSGCAEPVLHAHVVVHQLPHFQLLRPI